MLELTNYEMLDLAMSHVNASVDDLNRALALGSAYLICAYKVGRELTRFQVSVINVGFIVFVGQAMFGSHVELSSAQFFAQSAWSDEAVPEGPWQHSIIVLLIFGVVAGGAILACLAFMWSVRHPKTE